MSGRTPLILQTFFLGTKEKNRDRKPPCGIRVSFHRYFRSGDRIDRHGDQVDPRRQHQYKRRLLLFRKRGVVYQKHVHQGIRFCNLLQPRSAARQKTLAPQTGVAQIGKKGERTGLYDRALPAFFHGTRFCQTGDRLGAG